MSLDKWIKSTEKEDPKKKPSPKKKKQEKKGKQSVAKKQQDNKKNGPKTQTLIKFHLKCSKKDCNYQKTILKKSLHEKDTTCPRCKSEMKVKRNLD